MACDGHRSPSDDSQVEYRLEAKNNEMSRPNPPRQSTMADQSSSVTNGFPAVDADHRVGPAPTPQEQAAAPRGGAIDGTAMTGYRLAGDFSFD